MGTSSSCIEVYARVFAWNFRSENFNTGVVWKWANRRSFLSNRHIFQHEIGSNYLFSRRRVSLWLRLFFLGREALFHKFQPECTRPLERVCLKPIYEDIFNHWYDLSRATLRTLSSHSSSLPEGLRDWLDGKVCCSRHAHLAADFRLALLVVASENANWMILRKVPTYCSV